MGEANENEIKIELCLSNFTNYIKDSLKFVSKMCT